MGKQVKERKGGGINGKGGADDAPFLRRGGGGLAFFPGEGGNERTARYSLGFGGGESVAAWREGKGGGGGGLGEIFESPFFFEKGHSERGGRERRGGNR